MALTKPFEFKGIPIENAYFKIHSLSMPNKNKLKFFVSIHAKKDDPYLDVSEAYECDHKIGGLDAVAQCYAHLKTLTDFSGAVDVLEEKTEMHQILDNLEQDLPEEVDDEEYRNRKP